MNTRVDLDPISTGDIIDRSIRIYRQNFGALLAMVSIPGLISYSGTLMTVFGGFKLFQSGTINIGIGVILLILGYFLAVFFGPVLNLLAIGGLSRTIADSIFLNKPITFRCTYEVIREKFGTLLGGQLLGCIIAGAIMTGIILVLYFIVIAAVLFVIIFNISPWIMAVIFTPIIIIAIPALLIGYCLVQSRIVYIPCAITIENQGVSDSISRSFRLGSKNTWRIMQIFLFDFGIAAALASALGIPLAIYAFFSGALDNPFDLPTWVIMAYSTVDQLARLLTIPITTIAYCLLYFDNRVRKEGYDMELIINRLQLPPYFKEEIQSNNKNLSSAIEPVLGI